MWTYLDVHLYFTLPIILVEWLLVRPFFNVFDTLKVLFISVCAMVYTVPWDNYIVYNNAWTYPLDRILGVVGWIPYEEYAFFVIQTILVSLWTILWMRWKIPCLSFNYNKSSYMIIRWVPTIILLSAALYGGLVGIPGTKMFYMGSLLWWICPVIAFLWYGAGNYLVKRGMVSVISIMTPTIYLWMVDRFCLGEGIWHITEEFSMEIFFFKNLPIEEAVFFFLTDFLIVLANCAFDKSKSIIDLHPDLYPVKPLIKSGNILAYIKQTFRAFLDAECDLPKEVVKDLLVSISVLEKGSKSFTAAASAFDQGIRIDLSILYGFARSTDDMIDEEKDNSKKRENLKIIRQFLDQLFVDRRKRTWTYDVATEVDPAKKPKIDWEFFQKRLNEEQFRSFRALSRIAYYLPSEPFYELCRGYEWDIEDKETVTEDDLLEYSSYVASSIGTLCVFVMCYKSGKFVNGIPKEQSFVIERAREMGQVLQIVNISRDIATDSLTLGRCYVPSKYFSDREKELHLLKKDRDPWALGQDQLKKYALRMLKLADQYASRALKGIPLLPSEVQAPVLATTEIYRMIGVFISKHPGYQQRVYVTKPRKILIALTCMYAHFMTTKKKFIKFHKE